jgi:sortase B
MKKAVYVILIIVLLGVFGYSAYLLGDYYLAKYRSDKCVAQAVQHVHVRESSGISQTGDPEAPADEPEPEGIDVDFEALWKLNSDIVAWIYCPDTPINYPIVQADDNDYYLRRLLDGSWNIGGTLFLDYRCTGDFTGRNNVVYGHHMKSGTMFGSLVRYRDQSYYNEHPVMYLATPMGQYRVELFAGCTIDAMDNIYDINPSDEQILRLTRRSSFAPDHEISLDGPILTMSTCAYDFENARYVVIGRLVPIE